VKKRVYATVRRSSSGKSTKSAQAFTRPAGSGRPIDDAGTPVDDATELWRLTRDRFLESETPRQRARRLENLKFWQAVFRR